MLGPAPIACASQDPVRVVHLELTHGRRQSQSRRATCRATRRGSPTEARAIRTGMWRCRMNGHEAINWNRDSSVSRSARIAIKQGARKDEGSFVVDPVAGFESAPGRNEHPHSVDVHHVVPETEAFVHGRHRPRDVPAPPSSPPQWTCSSGMFQTDNPCASAPDTWLSAAAGPSEWEDASTEHQMTAHLIERHPDVGVHVVAAPDTAPDPAADMPGDLAIVVAGRSGGSVEPCDITQKAQRIHAHPLHTGRGNRALRWLVDDRLRLLHHGMQTSEHFLSACMPRGGAHSPASPWWRSGPPSARSQSRNTPTAERCTTATRHDPRRNVAAAGCAASR